MMAEQDYATVKGEKVSKSDFGYAPGDEPSKWKFPLQDAGNVRDAMARFNQSKDIPAGAKAALKRKIIERARKFGIDTSNFEKEYATEATGNRPQAIGFSVVLLDAGVAAVTPEGLKLHAPGAQLREIAVAVPGSFVKAGREFSITPEMIREMEANFAKRKNGQVVIDYEHASEDPAVAKGGPVPAAGWIHRLAVSSRQDAVGSGGRQLPDANCLTALVEWTPKAEEMLRAGEYRFFSPAIDFNAADKETGEPQGATLTSGALTNHPFLEDLPPIMLSDGTAIVAPASRRPQSAAETAALRGEKPMTEETERLAEREDEGKEKDLPKLKIRKGRNGSKHEGHHIVSLDDGTDVGAMSDDDLKQYAASHLGVNPDDQREEATGHRQQATEQQRRTLILTEIAKGGKIDSKKAIELSERGAITFADYIRAQEAEKMIDAAVREGKILPRDRAFFFRDALERPTDFAEYAKSAQAVNLATVGFGSAEQPSVDHEVLTGIEKLRKENPKLDYASAYKQFLSENPVLAEQYRAKHSNRVNADGTSQ
jgi:phage I-like protein